MRWGLCRSVAQGGRLRCAFAQCPLKHAQLAVIRAVVGCQPELPFVRPRCCRTAPCLCLAGVALKLHRVATERRLLGRLPRQHSWSSPSLPTTPWCHRLAGSSWKSSCRTRSGHCSGVRHQTTVPPRISGEAVLWEMPFRTEILTAQCILSVHNHPVHVPGWLDSLLLLRGFLHCRVVIVLGITLVIVIVCCSIWEGECHSPFQ